MPKIGIQILLSDGDPNGVKVIGLSGWKGMGFEVPRAKLKDIKNRPEVSDPGIYFLFGKGEDEFRGRVYIGESEKFYSRVENHDDNKDFWERAVIFTGGLNRAHVKHLENHSILLAKQVDRFEVMNVVEPHENKLSEFEKAETEDFFEKIKLILGVLGFAIFQEAPRKNTASDIYSIDSVGVQATGTLLETGEFIVFEGSTARANETPSFQGKYGAISRQKLEAEGILKRQNKDFLIFTKDHIFTSPSAASCTILARQSNGWTNWKDKSGRTLDEVKRK
jgi:hypothetical protein